MPLPRKLTTKIREILWGTPFGSVFPSREAPPIPPGDSRTAALRCLRDYLAGIVFRRSGGPDGCPEEFRVDPRDIMIGWPDAEKELRFPSIVFLDSGNGAYEPIGFVPQLLEDTVDKYGPGTVLKRAHGYVETVIVEVWANTKPELRAILGGIEAVLSPVEEMYGLRLRVADYYDQHVRFTPRTRSESEGQDAARGRRSARILLEMAYDQVQLVRYTRLDPHVCLEVVDGSLPKTDGK